MPPSPPATLSRPPTRKVAPRNTKERRMNAALNAAQVPPAPHSLCGERNGHRAPGWSNFTLNASVALAPRAHASRAGWERDDDSTHWCTVSRLRRTFSAPRGKKGGTDSEPDMLSGVPESAVYVQNPDDSRNSAIRIAYRNSLRPSSSLEPRHSSLKFSTVGVCMYMRHTHVSYTTNRDEQRNTVEKKNT